MMICKSAIICEYTCTHKIPHEKNARCIICEEEILTDKNTELPCAKEADTHG